MDGKNGTKLGPPFSTPLTAAGHNAAGPRFCGSNLLSVSTPRLDNAKIWGFDLRRNGQHRIRRHVRVGAHDTS